MSSTSYTSVLDSLYPVKPSHQPNVADIECLFPLSVPSAQRWRERFEIVNFIKLIPST
jgi:hypothetical protein